MINECIIKPAINNTFNLYKHLKGAKKRVKLSRDYKLIFHSFTIQYDT